MHRAILDNQYEAYVATGGSLDKDAFVRKFHLPVLAEYAAVSKYKNINAVKPGDFVRYPDGCEFQEVTDQRLASTDHTTKWGRQRKRRHRALTFKDDKTWAVEISEAVAVLKKGTALPLNLTHLFKGE